MKSILKSVCHIKEIISTWYIVKWTDLRRGQLHLRDGGRPIWLEGNNEVRCVQKGILLKCRFESSRSGGGPGVSVYHSQDLILRVRGPLMACRAWNAVSALGKQVGGRGPGREMGQAKLC